VLGVKSFAGPAFRECPKAGRVTSLEPEADGGHQRFWIALR